MNHIALLFGHQANHANNYKVSDLAGALCATGDLVWQAIGGPHPLNRANVNGVIDSIATKPGRPLIIGLFNGTDGARRPLNVFGGSSDINDIMQRLVANSTGQTHPVDIFMLVASAPRTVHAYAQQLPRGSTLIAFETDSASKHNHTLWNMLQRHALHRDHAPSARHLLLEVMLGSDAAYGTPEIAVSGQPRTSVHEAWEAMLKAGGVSSAAAATIKSMASHLPVAQADEVAHALRTIGNSPRHVKPINNQYYAYGMATMWDQMFVPSAAAPLTVLAPPAAAQGSTPAAAPATRQQSASTTATATTTAAPTPVPAGGRPRLTNSQAASIYKPGKPPHKQHPKVIQHILRRR